MSAILVTFPSAPKVSQEAIDLVSCVLCSGGSYLFLKVVFYCFTETNLKLCLYVWIS